MTHLKHTKTPLAVSVLATLLLSVALVFTSCANPSSQGSSEGIQQESYPLVTQHDPTENPEESQMNLYFIDGGSIPYVSVSEFMPFYASLFEDEDHGVVTPTFDTTTEGGATIVSRVETSALATFEPSIDIISFSTYDSFTQRSTESPLVYGLGDPSSLVSMTNSSYDLEGRLVEFDLSAYYIDLVGHEDQCYVPLQTMQDILLATLDYHTVFNGQKVFVFKYGCDLSDQIYTVPAEEMSQELADFNQNELLFMLDSFYGLRNEHGIVDFQQLIVEAGVAQGFFGKDPMAFDQALDTLTMRYLDDSHSGVLAASYLTGNPNVGGSESAALLHDNSGASSTAMSNDAFAHSNARSKYYPDLDDEVFLYEEIGDTAIVTFDSFTVDKNDYQNNANLDDPSDTIELVAAAHKQITREGSPIKNVVLDLSNNSGGDSEAATFVISWLAGGRPIGVRDTLTGAHSIVSLEADVNLDGVFDPSDTLSLHAIDGSINVYCLTSPASFSCGNLVPAVLKGAPGTTLIGKTTGGGSCIVRPSTTASGAQFQFSGTSQICMVKNGSFYNIDTGVEPDAPITKLETFYDRQKLVDFIHDLK